MILADKIINERKKNGWSQEELAEQLSVSRQSISKWEGAQSIPDIQKIIKMAEIFGVSTDYLLKDEMEISDAGNPSDGGELRSSVDEGEKIEYVKVSMEEANEYLNMEERVIPRTANLVSLCIFAPAFLIGLISLSQIPNFPVGENAMTTIGIIVLILMIAFAVFFFIVDGAKMERFEYLEKEPIETMYGVSGMVKEKKKANEQKNLMKTAIGVIICILSVIPLLIAALVGAADYVVLFMVSALLMIVGIGVNLLVRAGSWNDVYNKLLQEGDYTIKAKENSLTGKIAPVYWCLVTAIYLGWSFWTNDWDRTWIVWAVAGVVFGVVAAICNIISSGEKK